MKVLEYIKQNSILIAIMAVGAFLRFYHIDFQSAWLDEIHTLNEANPNLSISEVYDTLMIAEPHPPLFFYGAYILFKIFGHSVVVLRSFSAVIGIFGIYSSFLLGREIFNKKVGLVMALLVCTNSFHLYYSQDGRPYVLLFLFTTLAFYRMVKFLKDPTRKNALIYGVFAALMICSHFFGLFGLFAQYVILLVFILISVKEVRKNIFINSLLSGILTAILFLPALKLFIQTATIKQFWIEVPKPDAYTQIFHDFFNSSEILIGIINLAILFYFLGLSKQKDEKISYDTIINNKTVLSFLILIPWIILVILIPLIRSYLSIPMIINRYFINVLPAVLLIVSNGLFYFKNRLIRYSIVLILIVISLTDIIIVKDYYRKVNKTQFREVSQFIIDNNKNQNPVYTSLGWYFPYFLNNEKVKMNIIDKPLEVLVNEMVQDSTKKVNFWYVDGHNKPYTLSESSQKFLDDNFTVEDNAELYDCWTKLYVKNTESLAEIDLSKYKPLKNENGAKIKSWVEVFEVNSEHIKAQGWGYIEEQDAVNSDIRVVLISNGKAFRAPTQKIKREDITKASNNEFNLDNSGFSSIIKVSKLEKGKYRMGIIIKDKKTNKEGLVLTDKNFDISK